jgi:hypothetical protein
VSVGPRSERKKRGAAGFPFGHLLFFASSSLLMALPRTKRQEEEERREGTHRHGRSFLSAFGHSREETTKERTKRKGEEEQKRGKKRKLKKFKFRVFSSLSF